MAAVLAASLLAAGCASDGDSTPATTEAAFDDSDLADDAFTRTSDEGSAPPRTTVEEGPPATPPDPELPVSITNVNAAERTITITNHGTVDVELGELWLCEFPAYEQLDPLTLQGGQSVTIPNPHESDADDGELGLYSTNDFSDPDAILSYVEWGTPGHGRADVAIDAGVWETGAVGGGQELGTGGEFADDPDGWSVLVSLTGLPSSPPTTASGSRSSSPTTTRAPTTTTAGSTSPPPDDYSPPPPTEAPLETAPPPPPPDEY